MKIYHYCLTILAALVLFGGCNKDKEEEKIENFEIIAPSSLDLHTFPSAFEGYTSVESLTVTVKNTGNQPLSRLNIALDGVFGHAFETSVEVINDLTPDQTRDFTVKPKQGLLKDVYDATLYVSAGKLSKSFPVRFVVVDVIATAVQLISPPTQRDYGIEEPFNTAGMVVKVTYDDGTSSNLDLSDPSKYLTWKFDTPGESSVRLAVGDFVFDDITAMPGWTGNKIVVRSLVERIVAVTGLNTNPAVPDVIIVYADETYDASDQTNNRINILSNTNVVLKTPDGSDDPVYIRKNGTGHMFNINGSGGNAKLTLDGYVAIKGYSVAQWGDDFNNGGNPILYISNGGVMHMKGHSKIVGNVARTTSADVHQGGSMYITGTAEARSEFILDEYAEITKCGLEKDASALGLALGNPVCYGGFFFSPDNSNIIFRGNSKFHDNFIRGKTNNSYAAIGYTNGSSDIIVEGNAEISNNLVYSENVTAGVFAMLTSSPLHIKGGVIKNNTSTYKGASRGAAIATGNTNVRVYLTGTVTIGPGSEAITTEGDLKTDNSNCIGIYSGNYIIIEKPFSATQPILIDLTEDILNGVPFNFNVPIIRELKPEGIFDFEGDCPVTMFKLRNKVDWRTPFTVTPLTNYKINENGYVVPN